MAQDFVPAYLNISPSVNSIGRLLYLKKEAAKSGDSANWRAARKYGFGNWRDAYCAGLHAGLNGTNERDRKPVWYSHQEGENFRDEGDAHKHPECPYYLSRDSYGYYTNTDASETCYPIIARLPHGRYIAGYRWSSNGERVYFSEVFDNARDACRSAYHEAEKFADICREDSYRYDQARKLENEIEELKESLSDCFALRNHYKKGPDNREEAREHIANIRKKEKELKDEYSEYL